MNIGYYYLHINGDLIFKRYLDNGQVADFRESDFVRAFWSLDTTNRADAWRILVESKALGANESRIQELAEKWRCDDSDADNYANYVGVCLELDGDQWCAKKSDFVNLMESPVGFGKTKLDALSDLAKALGYTGQKLWGAGFAELVKVSAVER